MQVSCLTVAKNMYEYTVGGMWSQAEAVLCVCVHVWEWGGVWVDWVGWGKPDDTGGVFSCTLRAYRKHYMGCWSVSLLICSTGWEFWIKNSLITVMCGRARETGRMHRCMQVWVWMESLLAVFKWITMLLCRANSCHAYKQYALHALTHSLSVSVSLSNTYTHTHTHTHARTYSYRHVHMQACVCVHTHTHTHTHTLTHTVCDS